MAQALLALATTVYSTTEQKKMSKDANKKAPVAPVADDKSAEMALKRKSMTQAGTGAQKTVLNTTLG